MDKAEKRALIIGVSDYNSDSLPHLDFCTKDGQDLYELLKLQGYSIPDEYILTGQVNYDKIRNTILSFFTDKNIKPTDTLLFYFSGHGVPDEYGNNYLAASDMDPDLPVGRGLAFKELKSIADMSISTRIVSILDCCYAGAAVGDRKGSNANVDAKLARDAIDKIVPGRCVLASSQAYQESYGLKESGHSLFTYYLLDGLRGGNGQSVDNDGNITATKLSGYIYDTIMSLPPGKRPSQRPVTKMEEGGGTLILANYPEMASRKGTDGDYLLKLLEEEKIEEFNKIRKEGDVALYLRKVDLSGKNLRGVDLHEADLSDAKLIATKLTMTNLNGAKLKGVDLSGADLRSADLYGAILSGANLTRADLRGADLKGMIDFAGANLTGADIRGVDLTGMVNFSGAKLHDVDFTGSATNKGLINFAGADIRNAKGLPVLHERNEYLEGLKSFSESVKQRFKSYKIPAEQAKPIEESVKQLVGDVEDIQEPDQIDEIKRKNINSKFVDMAERVVNTLPLQKLETQRVFAPLVPFGKIIGGDVPQIIESLQKKIYSKTSIEDPGKPSPLQGRTGSPIYPSAPSPEKETLKEISLDTKVNYRIDDHAKPSPLQGRTGSPIYPSAPSPEKGSTEPIKKRTGEKKSSINKWIVLPIILVAVIAIAVGMSVQPHPSPQSTPQSTPQFGIPYLNPTYGVKMQYPSDWTKNETPEAGDFVAFDSPLTNPQTYYVAEVRVGTFDSSSSLRDDLNSSLDGYRNSPTWPNFQVINSSTSSTLAGQPAYAFVATSHSSYGVQQKIAEIGTIVDSKVYYITAVIDADHYSNYFPTVKQMINSFELSGGQVGAAAGNMTSAGGTNMTAGNSTM